MRTLMNVIAAKAWVDGENNDLPALRDLLVDADGFLQKRTSSEVDLLTSEVINQFSVSVIFSNLSPAAEKLGLTEESGRLKGIFNRIQELKARKNSKKSSPDRDLIYQKGSEIAAMFSPNVSSSLKNPPVLTDDELRPGRLIEHEVLSWACCYIIWAIMAVAIGMVAGYHFRAPICIRRIANRLEVLMSPLDWAWILGGGVLIPIFYVMAVTRLTSWGGRELNLNYTSSQFYSYNEPLEISQFTGLAVLMILLPVRIARWRIEKRATVFGCRQEWSWLGWVVVGCAFVFIPLLGWAVTRSSESGVYLAFYVAAIPVLWLLVSAVRGLCSNRKNLLQDGLIARILVPTYAVAAILMMAAVPYFKSAAYHWFEQEQFIKPDLIRSTMTKFDYKLAVQMRKETRQILGDQP